MLMLKHCNSRLCLCFLICHIFRTLFFTSLTVYEMPARGKRLNRFYNIKVILFLVQESLYFLCVKNYTRRQNKNYFILHDIIYCPIVFHCFPNCRRSGSIEYYWCYFGYRSVKVYNKP